MGARRKERRITPQPPKDSMLIQQRGNPEWSSSLHTSLRELGVDITAFKIDCTTSSLSFLSGVVEQKTRKRARNHLPSGNVTRVCSFCSTVPEQKERLTVVYI